MLYQNRSNKRIMRSALHKTKTKDLVDRKFGKSIMSKNNFKEYKGMIRIWMILPSNADQV